MRAPNLHRLSEIDPDARVGICAECGSVKLKKLGDRGWACMVRWMKNNEESIKRRRYRYNRKQKELGLLKPHRLAVGTSCECCGFVPVHIRQLDVHHLNGVHADNRLENLRTLCANCHRLEHIPVIPLGV